jgi:hypothetical protein
LHCNRLQLLLASNPAAVNVCAMLLQDIQARTGGPDTSCGLKTSMLSLNWCCCCAVAAGPKPLHCAGPAVQPRTEAMQVRLLKR